MGRAASFVARWRVTILVLTVAATGSALWIDSAKADGPGSGTASVAALGDSYSSGEAGRWAGNTHEESARREAAPARARPPA